MTTHALKSWPVAFADILAGRQTFDVRESDREYQVGDILELQEWKPRDAQGTLGVYTGREVQVEVTSLFRPTDVLGGMVMPGTVIMSIRLKVIVDELLAPDEAEGE